MSSSPPADARFGGGPGASPIGPASPHRPRRQATLRTKLLVSLVALIVLVCAVIGVVTEIFLSRFLIQQVDQRLSQGSQRVGRDVGPIPNGNSTTSGTIRPLNPSVCDNNYRGSPGGQTDGIVAAVENGVVVTAAQRGPFGCVDLDPASVAPLASVPAGSDPISIDVGSLGEFRAMATQLPGSSDINVSAASLQEVSETRTQLAIIMAIVAGCAIVLGAGVVFLVVRRSVRPLERVAATARQVSTLPLDKGEVDLSIRVPDRDTDTRTEIGQVGAALNQMLGHVSGALEARHASETRVRQFVADASHELRTPLAAIRGYSELARRDPDPASISHALRRVESESARMTTLVDDLLLLARLDSGRPLAREDVDLTMLVVDRVSDARVAGPDHRWRLNLPDEPVVIVGDNARLHQVLANLLANARTHTPPGTEVVTGLRVEGNWVLLTVTDNGPGIPAELQPEIFGRFVRGDSSRSRAAGSTGLGLAIVQAVISAHGGSVAVVSRPGSTRAIVRLPLQSIPLAPGQAPTPNLSTV